MSAWEHESQYDQCSACDHTYRPSEQCIGSPVPCEACCRDPYGQYVYVPMYVIREEVLA